MRISASTGSGFSCVSPIKPRKRFSTFSACRPSGNGPKCQRAVHLLEQGLDLFVDGILIALWVGAFDLHFDVVQLL